MADRNARFGRTTFCVQRSDTTWLQITVSGRDRWALECLRAAKEKGCTPIDTPGPRWSGYVHNLRNLGVDIETIFEAHEGPFPGSHARYVLRSNVKPTGDQGAAA